MGGVGQLVGDPQSDIYDPYIGLRGQGRKCCGCETFLTYRWRLIGSFFRWTNFTDPMTINCIGPDNVEIQTSTYKLNSSSGYMIEGEFEGIVPLTNFLRGTMWVRGHYDQSEGQGTLTSTVVGSTIAGVVPGSGNVDNAKIYKSYFATGLGLEFFF